MGHRPNQKRRVQGRSEPIFTGLAAEVHGVLSGLDDICRISCGSVRKYHGTSKVRIPKRWSEFRVIPITVCDTDFGEREIRVNALKPGAIARILRKRLGHKGIRVC